jgi:hypothetical protein
MNRQKFDDRQISSCCFMDAVLEVTSIDQGELAQPRASSTS